MSIEHAAQEPPGDVELDKTINGSVAAAAQIAVQKARRAADHAVMAIFELAFLLESLDDIIGRYNADAEHHTDRRGQ